MKFSFAVKVEATLPPEPDIKACSVGISFNSHGNPEVTGGGAEQVQMIEQQLLKMGEECARVRVNSIGA